MSWGFMLEVSMLRMLLTSVRPWLLWLVTA